MHVGICRLSLELPGNQHLKGKRQVSRSLIGKVRHRFNVSIAEVDDNNLWQRLTLGICCVSNDLSHANSVISHVVDFIESVRGDLYVLDYDVEMISGI